MSTKHNNLFRPEYFEAQKTLSNGNILIKSSPNQNIYLVLSMLVLLLIITFVTFAEYTRRETLIGVVSPLGGMVKVKANDSGYIDRLLIKEGDKVEALTPLYEIKTERFDGSGVGIKERIIVSIDKQYQLLMDMKQNETDRAELERNSLVKEITRINNEIRILKNLLRLSNQELELTSKIKNQHKVLLDRNFLSEIEYQKIQLDLISKQSELETNNLNLQKLLREEQNLITKINNIDINLEITLKNIDSQLEEMARHKFESLYQSDSQVRSPIKGIVTSILAKEGHSVSNGQPLLIIIPESTNTFVELYASSRNIGFMKIGQRVRLRFDAFPYEKFGTQLGMIDSISKSAVAPEMIDNHRLIKNNIIEGLYQVRVKLAKPTITIYGREEPLIPGMTAIADVELDTRNIYEWILEPLYTIKGKI